MTTRHGSATVAVTLPSDTTFLTTRQFDVRVQAMASNRWDHPTPCDGWVARHIITHLVTWVPAVSMVPTTRLSRLPSRDALHK